MGSLKMKGTTSVFSGTSMQCISCLPVGLLLCEIQPYMALLYNTCLFTVSSHDSLNIFISSAWIGVHTKDANLCVPFILWLPMERISQCMGLQSRSCVSEGLGYRRCCFYGGQDDNMWGWQTKTNKPTDTHQYLHRRSCHPAHCKNLALPIAKPFTCVGSAPETWITSVTQKNWRCISSIEITMGRGYNKK